MACNIWEEEKTGQPLYKGHLFQPHANILVYYLTSEIVSTRDKIVGPIVSLIWRFHCILYIYN